MKRRLFALITIAVLAASVGCGSKEAEEETISLNGADFWITISETTPYTQWESWPGYPDLYPGKSPHGKYLKLFANEAAITAVKEGKPMPNGAIIVKENYGEDQATLMAVTPMYKVDGYNPEGGDWFWAKYGPDGTVMAEGKIEGCITCHQSVEDKDWIFTEAK